MYYYSPSTRGFYLDVLHGNQIPADAIAMSKDQYAELVSEAPAYTALEYRENALPVRVPFEERNETAEERIWRDNELARTQWLIERHRDEQASKLRTSTLSDQQFAVLLVYRQKLRELPEETAFPDIASRPEPPDWLISVQKKKATSQDVRAT